MNQPHLDHLLPHPTLSAKDLRTANRLLGSIHGKRGVLSLRSIDDLEKVESLGGEVMISGRQAFITKDSFAAVRKLCSLLRGVLLPNSHISAEDVWIAVVAETKSNLASQSRPAVEAFLDGVTARIRGCFGQFTYAADFEGVELKDVSEIPLGRVMAVKPNAAALSAFVALGLSEEQCQGLLKHPAWLLGKYDGTPAATRCEFELDATMIAGVIGLAATIHYMDGFVRSRPVVHVRATDPGDAVTTLRWSKGFTADCITRGGLRGMPIEVTRDLVDYLRSECQLQKLVDILQRQERNEVQEAVARSVYWFAQAQRDSEQVMQYVKLWSCIESFFAFENDSLTERNAMGVASVLAFGDYQVVPHAEYAAVKQRMKHLYGQRSKAVHRAEHRHVERTHLSELSYWTAWCILTFVSFAGRGYVSLKQVWEQVQRLDQIALGGPTKP